MSPVPREILILDARAELARDDLPAERRAALERRVRELESSHEEYPSDFAPAGGDWLSEQAP